MKGILNRSYTTKWKELRRYGWCGTKEDKRLGVVEAFCDRYALQSAVHVIWRERNRRRHGEPHMHVQVIMKIIKKSVRNKLSLLCKKKKE